MKRIVASALLAAGWLAITSACSTRKDFPEPYVGWHNSSYSEMFGRLQRISGPTPDDPPTWVLRFGTPGDMYGGELALTPPERLRGYAGGESVEVKGRVLDQATTDAYNGRWYVVDSIQMWSTYR
jgi:hypothetical protein